jgi:restriction endonuclease S subunit
MQYSVVNYKTVKEEGSRIDPDYFMPSFLLNEKIIGLTKWKYLDDISEKITDFGAYSQNNIIEYLESGSHFFIRNQDIKDFFLEDEKIFIDKQVYDQLSLHLEEKDILVQRVGTLGKAGIVLKKDLPSTANQNLAQIKPDLRLINPFYLITFLNSKFGESYFERLKTGNVQPWLNLQQIKRLKIPIFEQKFQEVIERIVHKSFSSRNQSKSLYSQAEQLLLSELGLLDWKPKHTLSFIKNYSDTQKAERIDAEYFQPKYEEIIEAVKKYKGGFDTLADLTKLVGHPSNPPYETSNIENKTFIITQKHLANYFPADNFWKDEEALYTTDEFIEKNRKFILQKNDIILYSVGAYIGKANLYNASIKATIGSFLTLIRPKIEKINPFYLLVFLNSKIGQELTRRNSRGLAQQYIYPYDTKQVIVPILETKVQKEIERLILEGQKSHNSSKSLLEIAKRGVEIAIEKDEPEAERWIKNKLTELGIKI